jgi:transposase
MPHAVDDRVFFPPEQRHQVIVMVCRPPEQADRAGLSQWSIRCLAEALQVADSEVMSPATVQRILKQAELKPHRFGSYYQSSDRLLPQRMKVVLELYFFPPDGSRVFSVDEKPGIQARERLQIQPMQPGRIASADYEYRRHGTLDLIAAFEVHTGLVMGECFPGHNRWYFLELLDRLRRWYRQGRLYVIVDQLITHVHPDVKDYLARHPRLKLVLLPTHCSWLNQIELWFSILSRRLLRRGSFRSTDHLKAGIDQFIASYNRHWARPFEWTYTGDPLVTWSKRDHRRLQSLLADDL